MGLFDTLRGLIEGRAGSGTAAAGHGETLATLPPVRVRKAVLPVAGIGAHFLPATRTVPKEMFPIVDRPLIEYAVEEAAAAGIEEIIFVTSRHKRMIEDHFDGLRDMAAELEAAGRHEALARLRARRLAPMRFCAVRQDAPLGLGHALLCARQVVGDEPFAVLLPDELIDGPQPVLAQMLAQFALTPASLVAVGPVRANGDLAGHALARVAPFAADARIARLEGVVDRAATSPAAVPGADLQAGGDGGEGDSPLALVGRFVLTPGIFDCLAAAEGLSLATPAKPGGAGGAGADRTADRPAVRETGDAELDLGPALARLLHREPVFAFRYVGQHFDCGRKEGLLAATLAMGLRHPETADALREAIRAIAPQLGIELPAPRPVAARERHLALVSSAPR